MAKEPLDQHQIVIYLSDVYQDAFARIGNSVYHWCKQRYPTWSIKYPPDIRPVGAMSEIVGHIDLLSETNQVVEGALWRKNEPITVRK